MNQLSDDAEKVLDALTMRRKNVYLNFGMYSDDAEKLLSLLKGKRSEFVKRIMKSIKMRLDSASWAITGKLGSSGASIPRFNFTN